MNKEQINKRVIQIIESFKDIEDFELRLDISFELLINVLLQGKVGCFINKEQEIYFETIVLDYIKQFLDKVDEMLSLDEQEFLKNMKQNKIKSPKYADVFDETISNYNKLKREFKNIST